MAPGNNSERVREAIVVAATECFARHGVRRTTLAAIAKHAGVDLAELNAEFKNKSLLVLAVQGLELEQVKREYIANMPDATLDEMVKFIVRTRCDFVEKHHEQTMIFFRNAFIGRQPWSRMMDQVIWELSIEFASLFEKSIRQGWLKPGTDVNTAVRALTSFYLTGIVTIGLRAEKFEAAAVWGFVEPQIDLLLEGLKA